MVLHQVGARLRKDGLLYVYGHNDEGIKSAHKPAAEVFDAVSPVDARKHCRILKCERPKKDLLATLDDWVQTTEVPLPDGPLSFVSWPGLFAHGRLDRGTELLLRALPAMEPETRVLDWACGAGVVGRVLSRRNPGIQLDALDVDALAVHAARLNLPEAGQVYLSDAWSGVPKRRWDRIVSNPPLHTGVGTDHTALRALIAEAPRRMGRKGQLWLVAQRNVRLRPQLQDVFPSVRVAASTDGFKVWVAAN